MFFLKSIWFWLLGVIDPLLDGFSSRLCFFCERETRELLCEECCAKELSLKKKRVDYKSLDDFFEDYEQVFDPSIFFLCNFYKDTRYLITKAKYSRPHYSKTLAKYMSVNYIDELEKLFLDGFGRDSLENIAKADKKINLFVSYTPMYEVKEKQRSFNFAYELAKNFSLELKKSLLEKKKSLYLQTSEGLFLYELNSVTLLENFFSRTRNTRALYDLGREERLIELKGAFGSNAKLRLSAEGLNLLLIIDDICTTGSTLMELMKMARGLALFDEISALTLYGRNLKKIIP